MQCIFFVISLHCFIKQTYEQMCLIAYNYLERGELMVKKKNLIEIFNEQKEYKKC